MIKRESSTFVYPLLPVFAVTQLMITSCLCKLLPGEASGTLYESCRPGIDLKIVTRGYKSLFTMLGETVHDQPQKHRGPPFCCSPLLRGCIGVL